jgi:hypothetical protein
MLGIPAFASTTARMLAAAGMWGCCVGGAGVGWLGFGSANLGLGLRLGSAGVRV